MTMYVRIYVTTPWAVANPLAEADTIEATGHPQLEADYLNVHSWSDVTEQPAINMPTAPNIYVLMALVTEQDFIAILADPRYTVMSSEGGIELLQEAA